MLVEEASAVPLSRDVLSSSPPCRQDLPDNPGIFDPAPVMPTEGMIAKRRPEIPLYKMGS